MKLLSTANSKIKKGEKIGYRTFGIHLAPSNLSGFNTCQSASAGCAAACLNSAGMGAFSNVQKARIEKTRAFFKDRNAFMGKLIKEIESAIKNAAKNGFKPAFRLNLTSDLPFEKIKYNGKSVFAMFPKVQFYDYTASIARMTAFLGGEMPKNYHLTFSRKENTPDTLVESVLASGGNVAIVFDQLPKKYKGRVVRDGDVSDVRFKDGRGVVVGLKAKGKARYDKSGFVIPATASALAGVRKRTPAKGKRAEVAA